MVAGHGFRTVLASILVATFAGTASAGLININLKVPSGSTFYEGQAVPVEVWFTSTISPSSTWSSADIIFEWSDGLSFVSCANEPIPDLTGMTLAKKPPENGIVWSGAAANFGGLLPADAAPGTHVTTLMLKAEKVGPATITVLASDEGAPTVIYDENFENIAGSKGSAEVTIEVPEPVTMLTLAAGLLALRPRRKAL
jgi:hypothetical protein